MIILEHEAKALLRDAGLPIPPGRVVRAPEDIDATTPQVLKVQIPSGGRMKAGGVTFADTPDDARAQAADLLGREILGYTVDALLAEQQVDIATEFFIAVTYDTLARTPIIIASREGGIEVESAEAVVRAPFAGELSDYMGREVAARLGLQGRDVVKLGGIITRLARCFLAWDAILLECNPVILDTSGAWWVADVHFELDDDAAFRQTNILAAAPESGRWAAQRSGFEQRALDIDQADHRGVAGRLVPFDGDLGVLIGGGGASLTTMDAMLDAGLRPANYCEIGGNPSVWKIKELTKLILSQPNVTGLAVIMNVVSNTRVDLVARGVIKGVLESGHEPREVIRAFRIPGSWEDEGFAILAHYGIAYYGREMSIDEVVEAIR